MAILGINAVADRSSACSISPTLKVSALCDKHSRAFPHDEVRALQKTYSDIDTVATVPHAYDLVKASLPAKTRIERVDYCEALSMATICSTDWDSCALLLSDSYYTRLGYYVDGNFYWIREFSYPNSIALFSAAATRFLGFDAISGEDYARALSITGDPKYTQWLGHKSVHMSDGSYNLLLNLERGVGTGVPDADVAASAQAVFSAVLVNLAQWLRKNVDIPRLAIVGRSAANYISNTDIARLIDYDQIATISLNGAAATSLGAAALIKRPLYEHHYVGIDVEPKRSPDEIANELIQGSVVYHEGTREFSDNAFMNQNILTLPFEPRLRTITTPLVYAICQDRDYNTYFKGYHTPYYGQYLSQVTNKKALNYDYARVITVAKNKNPFINRVLELTRAQGYPILVSRTN